MQKHTYSEFGQERIHIFEITDKIDLEGRIRVHNYHLIMLRSGELTVDINFRAFRMKPFSTLHISSGEVIKKIDASREISGFHIIFSPDFQTELRTTRKSPIRSSQKKSMSFSRLQSRGSSYM